MRTPNYAPHLVDQRGIHRPLQAATIRSIFVHPAWARRGVMRRLMAEIEGDVLSAGIRTAALTATLTGIPFYRRLGYRGTVGPDQECLAIWCSSDLTWPSRCTLRAQNLRRPHERKSSALMSARMQSIGCYPVRGTKPAIDRAERARTFSPRSMSRVALSIVSSGLDRAVFTNRLAPPTPSVTRARHPPARPRNARQIRSAWQASEHW